MKKNGVRSLLMGGQACVLYGAAEFSRDTDLAIRADADNLSRLKLALDELQAACIAVPPFERRYLELGLALHFRCRHPDVDGMRIDILSKLRGVDAFELLWGRRTTLEDRDVVIDVLSLPDLVQAKKTQRDKDWPMIARLVEANYFANQDDPTPEQIEFWLRELRTPALLVDVARHHADPFRRIVAQRPLLTFALEGDESALAEALRSEENQEREADRRYWEPLKRTLERLRRTKREGSLDQEHSPEETGAP